MLWLHTARAKNPERTQIPNQTHLSTSDSYEYHPDISWTPPRHPPDTPQTSPGNKRCQQMTTDANRDKEPARDTPRHWRVLFEYVWQCQLAFVGVFLFMEVTRGCLGDVWGCLRGVWGVSEGIWVLFLEIGSAQMCFGFSAFAVRSYNIILAQPGKAWLFSPDHSETSKYQNVPIWGWQKWLSCMILLFLNARQKDIKNGSCKWSPCTKSTNQQRADVSHLTVSLQNPLLFVLLSIFIATGSYNRESCLNILHKCASVSLYILYNLLQLFF